MILNATGRPTNQPLPFKFLGSLSNVETLHIMANRYSATVEENLGHIIASTHREKDAHCGPMLAHLRTLHIAPTQHPSDRHGLGYANIENLHPFSSTQRSKHCALGLVSHFSVIHPMWHPRELANKRLNITEIQLRKCNFTPGVLDPLIAACSLISDFFSSTGWICET
jgi:hypothetical protein